LPTAGRHILGAGWLYSLLPPLAQSTTAQAEDDRNEIPPLFA
jgi:hypothetical protein